jgi:hypothetical protein
LAETDTRALISIPKRKRRIMWHIVSPFSAWVLPLRLLGISAFVYAFVRMLAAPDLTLIVVGILGSLLWQAGTAAEEHSPLYRRPASTTVRKVMRTRPIKARSWVSVFDYKSEHPGSNPDAFIITTQGGYEAGILTPEELSRVPEGAVRHTSVGQLAHPVSYVDGLGFDDPILEVFLHFRRSNAAVVPVLDEREALAGVLERQDLDKWLKAEVRTCRPLHLLQDKGETSEKKLAA